MSGPKPKTRPQVMASAPESVSSGDKPRPITHEQQLRRGIHQSGLPDGEVRLFMILLDKAEFGSAIMAPKFAPTVAKLEELCCKSRSTVFRRLAHLERHGWLGGWANRSAGRTLGSYVCCGSGSGASVRLKVAHTVNGTQLGRFRPRRESHLWNRESLSFTAKRVSCLPAFPLFNLPILTMGQRWEKPQGGSPGVALHSDIRWSPGAHGRPERWVTKRIRVQGADPERTRRDRVA